MQKSVALSLVSIVWQIDIVYIDFYKTIWEIKLD